jgi:hypothetical protein
MKTNPSAIDLSDLAMFGGDLEALGYDTDSSEYLEMITRLTNTFSKTEYHLLEGMQRYTIAECWKLFGESLVEE